MNLTLTAILCALAVLSWFLTYLIRNFALRKQIFDIPNERSSHDVPTPRGGGLAISITWFTGITVLFLTGTIERHLYFALLCGVLLALVSLADDLKHIRPLIRLIIQFLTAGAAVYFLDELHPVFITESGPVIKFILYALVVTGMVWFINLYNFMDGIDGFASVEAITISCFLFALSLNIIFVILIACVAGFLYWNWPKAKIFMGDVGSTQLGFILAVLGIYLHNNNELSILNWAMLTSAFWFDASLTLYRKWRNGEKLSEAHRKHAYQRIVQAGFSHLKVDVWLIMINLFIMLLVLASRRFIFLQFPLFALNVIVLFLITKQVDLRMPFKKSGAR